MERELFVLIMDVLRAIPAARRRPPQATYSDLHVLSVAIWAALHDRPISWATQRRNWPLHDRVRALPSDATMSRRLRDPVIGRILDELREALGVRGHGRRTLIVDGRALTIARHSADPDATMGRVSGGFGKGYKLHAVVDSSGNCRGFGVEPLHVSEQAVARTLIGRLCKGEADVLLADGMYDVNTIYEAAGERGVQMIAARRYKNAKGVGHRRHSVHRLRALEILAEDPSVLSGRRMIESCFGTQGNVIGGLGPLPNHVRRLHRVRRWVSIKLVIDAAHRRRRNQTTAA